MKQYIVTEEQIKAVEGLLTSMCNCYGKPASMQAAIDAVTAGLRNHEYVETPSYWIKPGDWPYPDWNRITCKTVTKPAGMTEEEAVKEAAEKK